MTSDHSSPDRIDSHFSRRALFRTIGLATGGAMLLGLPKIFGGWTGEAEAAVASKGSIFSRATLEVDGAFAGFLTAVEGGNTFVEVLPETVGPDMIQRKRPGAPKFEDLVIEAPLDGDARPLFNWIAETLAKGAAPRNGAAVFTDFNFAEVKRLEFFNAVISEIVLPACDAAAAKTPAHLTIRITPQSTRLAGGSGKPLPPMPPQKTRFIIAGNFRFNVQGLENACKRISTVEAIVIKRPVLASPAGQERSKSAGLPGVIDCGIVRISLPEGDAAPFYSWLDDTVVKGRADGERGGLLEWFDPTLKNVVASVQLSNLGIVRYAPAPFRASSTENAALTRIDMYCESISLTL